MAHKEEGAIFKMVYCKGAGKKWRERKNKRRECFGGNMHAGKYWWYLFRGGSFPGGIYFWPVKWNLPWKMMVKFFLAIAICTKFRRRRSPKQSSLVTEVVFFTKPMDIAKFIL